MKKVILQKKLKAIVFTDMADFTKISAQNEQKALDRIQKQIDIIKPIVEKHNGEWLKELGDGLLLSFDSSLEAVRCSIEIQETLKNIDDLNIRIGIHQGDIFIKDGDVFGDDVNIASRIEGFAPIGGISISDKVHNDISDISDIKSSFMGHRNLKGVQQETKIRCITSHNLPINKTNVMAKFVAYACFFWSASKFMACILALFLLFSQDMDTGIEELNTLHTHSELLTKLINAFLYAITSLLVGYSCLSYYKGLSIKAQKWLVNLSFLYIIHPIVGIVIKLLFSDFNYYQINNYLSIEYGLSSYTILLVGILLFIFLPLSIVILFRIYYYFKKYSSLWIFKRKVVALLLLLIYISLYIAITFYSVVVLQIH